MQAAAKKKSRPDLPVRLKFFRRLSHPGRNLPQELPLELCAGF
jgi:hypothetical protein